MGAKQSSERRAGGGEAPPVGRASTLIGGTPLIDLSRLSRNPNVKILAKTLGPEIWEQTAGRVTHFVAGGSTGGTVSGTGKYLKEVSGGAVKVLCPDPVGSVLLGAFNNGKVAHKQGVLAARSYCVEGVGKDSVPGTMNFDYVDSMISVTDKQAFDMCQRMSETEGVLAGGSGGLNVHGCVELSGRIDSGVIVTVLPDSGIKYLSKIYSTEWRKEKGFGKELEADPQREASAEIIRTALQDRDPFQGVLSK
eukprot:PRCOL_00002411-RA